MKIKSIKRLDALANKGNKKSDPFYIIDNCHITLSSYKNNNNQCILCNGDDYNKPCINKLDDIGLHIFMSGHDEWFALFLDQHSDKSIDKTEYTGFVPHPDSPDNLCTLIFNREMEKVPT